MKKQDFKNHEESLRRLSDISKRANVWIIGGPEGEEREKKIENLFEKIITVNFPNLMKEIDIQVQEQSPKQDESKEAHTKTHHN